MAHTPLLVGADGEGLSKRLGSLSISQLAEDGVEPMAIASLLARIGTSDPVEVGDSLDQLAEAFSFEKIGRASARFDEGELMQLNAEIVHARPFEAVRETLAALDPRAARETFWLTVRANCERVRDAAGYRRMALWRDHAAGGR